MRKHIGDCPSQAWEYAPFMDWHDEDPLAAMLQCDRFTATNGDTYEIVLGEGGATVPEVMDVFKAFLESKRYDATEMTVDNVQRVVAGVANELSQANPSDWSKDNLLAVRTNKPVKKCTRCSEIVAEAGKDTSCKENCLNQLPGGAWIKGQYGDAYPVGKRSDVSCKMFATVVTFKPAIVANVTINKASLAGSMM